MWTDAVDDILAGDQVVALAYATPANGVVINPLTNFALRDRERGTLSPVNSSVGVWKKLAAIQRNPRVALAYHTRTHGFSERPEYVLVQGTASLAPPDPHYPRSIRESWERYGGPVDHGPLWNRWLRVFNQRVAIDLDVERVIVWPGLACHGTPAILGAPVRGEPEPQRAPAKGTGPRVNHRRAAKRAARLPNRLLGWVGADGFPIVVPVTVAGAEEDGIALEVPRGLVPRGGRRAGLLAHEFARYTFGQVQRKHTGWLEAEPGEARVLYAPHTESGYHLPASKFLFRLVAGAGTRAGLRGAREAGFAA